MNPRPSAPKADALPPELHPVKVVILLTVTRFFCNKMKMLVLGGATATGKSELACCVAQRLGGEIISADSMSVYRGMDIGTAKPLECMRKVKHHLIDILNPGEVFDAKLFEEEALKAIGHIVEKGKVPIIVGGTYLYIQALLYGIEDTPKPNWRLREKLYSVAKRKGKAYLHTKLLKVDPPYASKIHPNDTRRVVRALEVFIETGKPFSFFHRWDKPKHKYIAFHITRDWDSLSKRIEKRVRKMVEEGLLEEVKRLLDKRFEEFLTSSQAIGYKELIPYFRGEKSLEQAVEDIVKNTKAYAKRQIRWFRKQGWREINLDKLSLEDACSIIVDDFKGV